MMSAVDILKNLLLALVLSGVIGWERERSHGYAGLKTHMLVGISSAIVAMIQVEIFQNVLTFAKENPELASKLTSDPARLTAQVISGIGFLGAGTIIVTKSNITGLTTAASIWSVACLGIACGMGYYKLAILSGFSIMFVLFLVKRFMDKASFSKTIMVKYVGGNSALDEIKKILSDDGLEFFVVKHDLRIYEEFVLYTTVFEIEHLDRQSLDKIVLSLTKYDKIINCQTTNLEK